MARIAQYYEFQIGESIRIALDALDGNLDEVTSEASQLRLVKYRPVNTRQPYIGDAIDADIIPMTIGEGYILAVDDTADMVPGWYLQDFGCLIAGAPYITDAWAIRMLPAVTSIEL